MPATDRLALTPRLGPLVLDAAIGTRLIAEGLDLAGDDPTLWVADRPEAVLDLHRRDVLAGSDAVLANTFGANRDNLARFGRAGQADLINRRAVALAREAAGPARLVLGAIGPTASPVGLREQVDALTEAGVDALVLETHRLDQALAALAALSSSTGPPIVASLFARPGEFAEAARRLEAAGVAAIGANCVIGMAEAVRIGEAIRTATRLPIWLKPSAGLPGGPIESPEGFAALAAGLDGLGPVLVGGCCGTTEAHVSALRAWGNVAADRRRGR